MATDEDIGELKRQLEEVKAAQAGSDRAVYELRLEKEKLNKTWQSRLDTIRNEKEELEQKLEGTTSEEARKAAEFDRRLKVHEYSVEKGRDPQTDFEILGLTGLSEEERIDRLAEHEEGQRLEQADTFAKANGRTPHFSPALKTAPEYRDMLQMEDREIARLGEGAVNRAVEKEKKEQKQTLGQKLVNSFKGDK